MTTKRRGMRTGLAAPLGLAAALLASACRDAGAQYAGSIPFDTWGAAYDAYVYPIAPTNPSIPNGARFNANELGGPNQFNNLRGFGPTSMDSGNVNPFGLGSAPTLDPGSRSRLGPYSGGRYVPYWSVNRLYDQDYGRTYTPNEKADAEYYSNRERRDGLYAEAMSERDPVKRAELMKKAEQATLDARRELGGARRRNVGDPSAAPATRPRTGTAPTAPAAGGPSRGIPFTKEELDRARSAARQRSSRGTPLGTGRSRAGTSRGPASAERPEGSAPASPGGIPAAPPVGGGSAPREETPDQVIERSRRMGLGSDLDALAPYSGGFGTPRRGGDPEGASPRRAIPPAPEPR